MLGLPLLFAIPTSKKNQIPAHVLHANSRFLTGKERRFGMTK
jgi:hypothetical protein